MANKKTATLADADISNTPVGAAAEAFNEVDAAIAALRPFADLPIRDDQPDDAHPAFQIKVGFIRAARKLFPEYAPAEAVTPEADEAADTSSAEQA